MTRDSLSLRVAFLWVALGGFLPVLGQPTVSPLVGKTVRVYNPVPGGVLNVDMSGTGYPMTSAGNNWMTYTIPATIQPHITRFGVRNDYGQGNFWIGRTGLANGGADAFLDTDFAGKDTLWIIIDPSGPTTAAPKILTEPPRQVHILNPWRLTAPVLILPGGGRKTMLTVSDRCGWFMVYLLEPTQTRVSFAEITNAGTYGSAGLGSNLPYDLTAEFTSKGPSLWLDTQLNTWFAAWPNKDDIGGCQYQMAAVVRDFAEAHEDFNPGGTGAIGGKGMVNRDLGPDNKPVRTATAFPFTTRFNDWFNTTPASVTGANKNYETCVDLPMSKTNDGMWEYDSYAGGSPGYFPIEAFTNPNNERNRACGGAPNYTAAGTRNMNFCMEAHAKFRYRKGQTFSFRGDDDVWVFINKKLVIDLGGIHEALSDSVLLDTLGRGAGTPLVEGQEYAWDFFFCERKECGSSLRIKTSIFFEQVKALEAVEDPPNSGTFKIIKREGGTGACGSAGGEVKEVPVDPTKLVYKLRGATTTADLESLGEGSFHNGGIVIATPSVVVDTSKITALPPGNYRVVAYEIATPNIVAEVPFKITARNLVEFHQPAGDTSVPLGTLVRLILANKEKGALVPMVAQYLPTVAPATGLDIYLDPLKTVKYNAGSALSTDATGYDTLWVTDTALTIENKVYSLSTPLTAPIVRITFVVPKNKVELEPPVHAGNHLIGTLVRVVAANREGATLVPKADPFTLVIPAGLDVYTDAAGTQKVAPGAVLTTDATGFDSLWVTSTVAVDADYVLGITGSGKTVTIRFLTPKDRMQFDAPHTRDTLVGSLVRLTASNRENGTLVPKAQEYTLTIPAGLQVFSDAARQNPVANGTRLTSAADGLDTLWVTADSVATNYEDKTFVIAIADGLNPVTITFRMPPLVLPQALTAAMFDEDADGIPDRLTVTYDRDIAGNLPNSAEYRWPAAATPPVAITDLAGKVAGTTLTHVGPMTAAPATGGDGVYVSTYNARNKTFPQAIAIHDRMGPVLTKAEIELGAASDVLHLKFSEPINTAAITGAPGTLFGYKVLLDGLEVTFEPTSITWDADRQGVSLAFPNPSTAAPRSGNFVRISDGAGLIADANGNQAGRNALFRRITGQTRVEIHTVTYRKVAPDALLHETRIAPSQQSLGSDVKDVVEKTGRMGHLIKTDLGDFAVGEDLTPLPPSQVALEYAVSYFTNHGLPVTSEKRTLFCNDPVFQGDCLKYRGHLFVGWNYTSQDGRKVATGAYVSRIRYQVKVAGVVRESGGLDQVWGILRQD